MIGDALGEGAFAGGRRTVDGNDHRARPAGAEKRAPSALHERDELGKARRHHARVVDRHRLAAGQPHGEKCHGDAVVEVRRDRAAAAHAARATDRERIAFGARDDAVGRQPGNGRRQPVALLHLQLGQAVHARLAIGEGGDDGEDRILVDHARRAMRRDVHAGELRVAHADVGDGLAPLLAHVRERDVGPHLAQHLVEADARRVDEHALEGDVRALHQRGSGSEERRRARVGGNGDVAPLQLGLALDGDACLAAAHRDRHLGAEVAQHALRVIARRLGLDHRGLSRRMQAGKQHGAFDLRRGDRQLVLDGDEIGRPARDERQPIAAARDFQPHLAAAARARGPSGGG